MRNRIFTALLIIFMAFLLPEVYAQRAGWKQDETKDGKVVVYYQFQETRDEQGKKYNSLKFEAITTAKVSAESCLAVLLDDSKHKDFMADAEHTERLRTISENEWITYYALKSRWPMPDSDVVTRYKLEKDPGNKRFVISGTPAPDMYPEQGVERMRESYSTYTISDLGNGETELIMYSSSVPLFSIPKWLLATWIPNGPADMVLGIIKLALEGNQAN